MPLKVRCRCGQELVLRYREWVYFVIGFLAIALLVNIAVLILIYLHLRDVGEAGRESAAGVVVTATETVADEREGEAVRRELAQRRTEPSKVLTGEPGLDLVDVPEAETEAVAVAVAVAETEAETDTETETDTATPPTPRPAFHVVLDGLPPLVRFCLLEVPLEFDNEAALLEWWGAFLFDPDSRVRARAARQLFVSLSQAEDRERHARVLGWANRAADWLSRDADGRRLLSVSGSPGAGSARAVEPPWEALRARAERLISGDVELEALRQDLEQSARVGRDVLLAIDVTESMAEPFDELQRVGGWLLSLLIWAVPNSRVGLLFYRDEVAATVDFDGEPLRLTRSLEALTASGGGGDVPEGVLVALEASLQLGRFSWREGAEKTLVFLGDAPPPAVEKARLLSLARQAHSEGHYEVHTVSLADWDGWSGVPYFADLARAGGGRTLRAAPGSLYNEIPVLLLEAEAGKALRRVLPSLTVTD